MDRRDEIEEPEGSEALEAEDRDSARIVARVQGGESEAFGELYVRYFKRVFTYMKVVLDNEEDAEDATQHVFTQAFASMPKYVARPAHPFRAWLFRIVRNHAVNELRRKHRVEVTDPAELDRMREDVESAAEPELPLGLGWITDPELAMFVERLPLPQRQVLLLRYLLDLTDSQIEPILGRPASEVRVLQHRAVTFLRKRLAAIGRKSSGGGGGGDRAGVRRPVREAPVLRQRRFSLSP